VQRIMKPHIASQQFIVGNDKEQGSMGFDKPFESGDYISIVTPRTTLTGKVLTIEVGSTKLKSVWGNIIIIPDSLIASATITNHCAEERYLQTSVKCTVEKEKVAETL